jgi:glycosyltransferase involved in cell wall biosynthesis
MRIAVVAPSPNPFLLGGAENLWWGMLDHLNGDTPHIADLVKLPVKETSLVDLVAGYEAFSRLDMSGFDAVISTKYPAWMVSHPRHVVYMQHRCRGYFDWYPAELPKEYGGRDPAILDMLAFMERNRGRREALPEFFARFEALHPTHDAHPEFFEHPGPCGRAVIHFLDGVGLAPRGIRRYAAIADAVRRRPGYFPRGVDVRVVHHPINKTGYHDAGEGYFFTASRLYWSKRIHLLVEAYLRTGIPLPFRIAGTGDQEPALRELAAGDPRIEFLGYVDDRQLLGLYAGAIAVPFVPYDEDFGYITLEAMLSGKPVITASDSGGPLELVEDGVTGLVCAPDVESIAAAMRRIHEDREAARAMGRHALERARAIDWRSLFSALLDGLDGEAAVPAAPQPASRVRFAGAHERRALRTRLGIDERPIALVFAADAGGATIESLKALAAAAPEITFALLADADAGGASGRAERDNLWLAAAACVEEREVWLHVADVALDLSAQPSPDISADASSAGTPFIEGTMHAPVAGVTQDASRERLLRAIREAIAPGPRGAALPDASPSEAPAR